MAVANTFTPKEKKRILTVLFTSLVLDLISFTFILPLFPKLLEFYRSLEKSNEGSHSVLNQIFTYLNSYKNSFARPINDRYDIVLLGGALGSLFSLLQAIASPIIGTLSDRHGRRTALLWSMAGNILSVALWVAAVDFRTFLASRIIGGLSEGNVQLAMAMATDVSDEQSRQSTMAWVGVCFSVAFTLGPALGAALSTVTTVSSNPFATAAGFSLFLLVTETLFLYLYLPETLPPASRPSHQENGSAKIQADKAAESPVRTNSRALLNFTHFAFLLIFSGMEFSLPFMTYDLFGFGSTQSGRLLGFIGLTASLLQGSFTRRSPPLRVVQTGVVSCAASFFLLARIQSKGMLYLAAALLAVTSATVVTGLTSLSSFEAGAGERGSKLGNHRSWGQVGRATGPLVFCTLYWWAGREVAYTLGGVGMLGVATLVFSALKTPPGSEKKKRAELSKKIDTDAVDVKLH